MPLNFFSHLNRVYGLPSLLYTDLPVYTPAALDDWRAMMIEDDQALEELASIGIRFRDRGEGLELAPMDPTHKWTDEEIDANHIAMAKLPRVVELAQEAGLTFVNCEQMPDRKKANRFLRVTRALRLVR